MFIVLAFTCRYFSRWMSFEHVHRALQNTEQFTWSRQERTCAQGSLGRQEGWARLRRDMYLKKALKFIWNRDVIQTPLSAKSLYRIVILFFSWNLCSSRFWWIMFSNLISEYIMPQHIKHNSHAWIYRALLTVFHLQLNNDLSNMWLGFFVCSFGFLLFLKYIHLIWFLSIINTDW